MLAQARDVTLVFALVLALDAITLNCFELFPSECRQLFTNPNQEIVGV